VAILGPAEISKASTIEDTIAEIKKFRAGRKLGGLSAFIELAPDSVKALCGMLKGKCFLKDLEEERARELAEEEEKTRRP
jgi:hypothetical protein